MADMLGNDYRHQDCTLARTLEVIGERWTLLIVRDAFYGVRRYNDFAGHLDIPKAVLADRLRGLVDDGILARLPDPEHGGRHLYQLTPAGRDLWPVLYGLLVWGERHGHPNSRVFKHAECDTQLDVHGHCGRCDLTPEPEDILTEPRHGRPRLRHDPVANALTTQRRLLDPLTV